MALSSEVWTPGFTAPTLQSGPGSGCGTVLMSVRVSVSPLRGVRSPAAGQDEAALRLQLSMDPQKPGEFRLTLRDAGAKGRILSLAEFDLRTVRYDIKSPRCHELRVIKPPHDVLSFTFRSEQEAQEWATVIMSSQREAHRVAGISCPPTEDSPNYLKPVEQNLSKLSLADKEDLCAELAKAIEAGDTATAVQHVTVLAGHQMALTIQPAVRDLGDEEILLAVAVEDATSSCCVTVKVLPHMTVASLKQQMFAEYGFHPRVQRWVIGQCLCSDQRTLASYNVCRDRDTAFLYLLSARHTRLSRLQCQQDQESALLAQTPPLKPAPTPAPANHDWRGYSTLPPRLHHSHPGSGGGGGGAEKPNISDLITLDTLHVSRPNEAVTQSGWPCPSCTFINQPTRPGCEICSTERPSTLELSGSEQPAHPI